MLHSYLIIRPLMDLFFGPFLRLRIYLWTKKLRLRHDLFPENSDFWINAGYLDFRQKTPVPYCQVVLILPTDSKMNEFIAGPLKLNFESYVKGELIRLGIKRPDVEFASEEDIKRSGVSVKWHYFK